MTRWRQQKTPARWPGANGVEPAPPSDPPALLDERAFRDALQRQRALADRTGTPCVLVSFSVGAGNGADPGRLLGVLADTVRTRVRLSDVAGWQNGGSAIGIILTGTPAGHARHAVRAIEAAFQARGASLHGTLTHTVTAFPDDTRRHGAEAAQCTT